MGLLLKAGNAEESGCRDSSRAISVGSRLSLVGLVHQHHPQLGSSLFGHIGQVSRLKPLAFSVEGEWTMQKKGRKMVNLRPPTTIQKRERERERKSTT